MQLPLELAEADGHRAAVAPTGAGHLLINLTTQVTHKLGEEGEGEGE